MFIVRIHKCVGKPFHIFLKTNNIYLPFKLMIPLERVVGARARTISPASAIAARDDNIQTKGASEGEWHSSRGGGHGRSAGIQRSSDTQD